MSNRTPFHAALLLCLLLTPFSVQAGEWELKTDLEYTEGARSDVTTYDGGSFDKRKYKRKYKSEATLLLSYTVEAAVPDGLEYSLRTGYIHKRVKDIDLSLKEDGSIKKDKTRTEVDRIPFAGLALKYKLEQVLGADRWVLSGRYDRYLDVSYSAHGLHEDANERSGDLDGYEWKIKAAGEYSTPWLSLYLLPYLEFKQERFSFWHDDLRDKDQEAEKENQYEAGLFLNWITPAAGWELIGGGYWQKERDAEKEPGQNRWQWEDQEQWIAKLGVEYESPMPGFELEFFIEEHLDGVDQGERQYSLELSYEF